MNVSKASKIWLGYHLAHSKENIIRAYNFTIKKFCSKFGNIKLDEVSMELYLKVVFKGKGGVSTGRLLAAVNRPH